MKDFPSAITSINSLVDFRSTRCNYDIPTTSKFKKKGDKKQLAEHNVGMLLWAIGGEFARDIKDEAHCFGRHHSRGADRLVHRQPVGENLRECADRIFIHRQLEVRELVRCHGR